MKWEGAPKSIRDLKKPPTLNSPVKDFHTHPFSGDRLWSNIKCPICRQHGIPVIDYKDDLKKKEIEQDRLLLKLSLDVDSEFLKKKKVKIS